MEKGPYVKEHPFFQFIRVDLAQNDPETPVAGFTYETSDTYACIWLCVKEQSAPTLQQLLVYAQTLRSRVNSAVGYNILSKPDERGACDQDNPFTTDAVCLAVLPRDVAERADKYGGNPMAAALAACIEAGAEVRLGNVSITRCEPGKE